VRIKGITEHLFSYALLVFKAMPAIFFPDSHPNPAPAQLPSSSSSSVAAQDNGLEKGDQLVGMMAEAKFKGRAQLEALGIMAVGTGHHAHGGPGRHPEKETARP
jgi:hypothetical protein